MHDRLMERISVPPQLQALIEERLEGAVRPALKGVGGSSIAEQAWRSRYFKDERARLETFATRHGDFMPISALGVERWGGVGQNGNLQRSLFDYWEPTYSCGDESRVPPHVLGDGPKWLCGARAHQHCTVLSVGSDFDASFEQGMHEAAGCTSYIIDPTLAAKPKELRHFERSIARFAHVNSSVGLGRGASSRSIHTGYATGGMQLVNLSTLLRDHYGPPPTQISVLKLDIETFEWEVLPELWELCSSGKLVLDQLNVELHTLMSSPLLVRHVYAAFEGALACGLALHHKEMNTFTWHLPSLNRLAEFSWVSLAHAQRSVTERERPSQSSAGPSEAHQLRRQPLPVDPAEAAGAEPRPLGQPVGDVAPLEPMAWSMTEVPANRQFACRRDVTSMSQCLSLAMCPLQISRRRWPMRGSLCRTRCVQAEGCATYTFNAYGQCYLRSALGIGRADDHRHGTVTCARMTGYEATWRENTWPFAGMYRLTDILRCSRLAEHLITRQAESSPNVPFFCGALDPANIHLQWPGSIADSYVQQAKVPYDLEALKTVIDRHAIALDKISCGAAQRPRIAACVFHIRAGDIFRNCTVANSSDCVAHSAEELWRGRGPNGTAWRSTNGEKMVQPRSYFERALRYLPNGTRSAIIVGQLSTQAGTPEAGYVALLTAWLEARGLTVLRHQAVVRGQFDHRQVDCELLFMARSRCFVPSGGGFSQLVAQMVERKGGSVMTAM